MVSWPAIASPPSEWQWCLKCPNNFQCNCILPLCSHLPPGGLPSLLHCNPQVPTQEGPHIMLSGALLGASVTLPSATTTYIANAHFTQLYPTLTVSYLDCIPPSQYPISTVSHRTDLSRENVKLPSTSPLREMGNPLLRQVARSRFETACSLSMQSI